MGNSGGIFDANMEYSKFEKVEGLLDTVAAYNTCYQKLLKSSGAKVGWKIIGTSGDSKPQQGIPGGVEDATWEKFSPEKQLESILTAAEETVPLLKNLCVRIGNDFSIKMSMGPLKKTKRACEKRDTDYGGDIRRVVDFVRCSGILTAEQLQSEPAKILSQFKKGGSYFDEWEFVRSKDGFAQVDAFLAGGYRDLKIIARHRSNKHCVEIQLHAEPFHKIKVNGGHAHYKFSRTLKIDGVTDAVSILSGLSEENLRAVQEVALQKINDAIATDGSPKQLTKLHKRLAELYEKGWQHGKKAIVQYELALKTAIAAYGPVHTEVARVLCRMAYCLAEMQRHCDRPNMQSEDPKWMSFDIKPLIERALKILTNELGPTHPFTLRAMRVQLDVLDGVYERTIESRTADENKLEAQKIYAAYNTVMQLQRTHLGIAHPDTLETMNNLGDFISERFVGDPGKVEEAVHMYEIALDAAIERMDIHHPLARCLLGNIVETIQYAKEEHGFSVEKSETRMDWCRELLQQMGVDESSFDSSSGSESDS